MSGSMIEVVPQPRVDLLVDDVRGARRRLTEYSGVVWFGGRPPPTSAGTLHITRSGRIETPFFLPDCLPYRADALADATLSITVAVASLSEHVQIFDQDARFVADPNGRPIWIQAQVLATGRVPLALSYRVVALTAPDAIETA